jgi:hypothetical protein
VCTDVHWRELWLQVARDGTHAVTSSKDKTAKILDLSTLQVVRTYTHTRPVNSAAESPVGHVRTPQTAPRCLLAAMVHGLGGWHRLSELTVRKHICYENGDRQAVLATQRVVAERARVACALEALQSVINRQQPPAFANAKAGGPLWLLTTS